ncbi:hypothetical protein [Streptomyces sp. NPDC058441]|uniref:HEAT repeat domain-containing protein n=1 Tax=Streptomyces sp. NPDC058441 TaxID=3346502 RepID=UPI0036546337
MIAEQNEELLVGLDDIDWASLDHAYGSADDVPRQLRQVCGDDEAASEDAWRHLFSNIFHQGTRYTASPYAVPFLSRIAIAGPQPTRPTALLMLTRLAVDWHDEYDLPGGIDTVAWRAAAAEFTPEKMVAWYDEELAVEEDPDKRQTLEEVQAYCAAGGLIDSRASALPSYDAVRAELPALFCLLEDPDPEIRTRTAYLLAWFPEDGAHIVPELLAHLDREDDARATATALVAAGLVGDDALVDRFRPWLAAPDPLVRWGAATALARLVTVGPDTSSGDDALVAQILTVLTGAAAAPMSVLGVDFNDGNLRGYAARSLAPLAVHAPDAILSVIVNAFGGLPDHETRAAVTEALTAALTGAFPSAADQTGVPFIDLGAGRQHILRFVAEHGPWGQYGTPIEHRLRELGLPDNQPALCAYTQIMVDTSSAWNLKTEGQS